MNKFAMTAATAALMLSLSAGALAASGLGSVTTMSGAGAKAGSVTVNTTMCELELDDAGKITAVSFDIAQNKVGFDATGALTGELTGEHPTKKELGDGYGMIYDSKPTASVTVTYWTWTAAGVAVQKTEMLAADAAVQVHFCIADVGEGLLFQGQQRVIHGHGPLAHALQHFADLAVHALASRSSHTAS